MEPAEKQIAKPRSKAQSYLALLRVHQWLKNAVVFAALIFGHRLLVAGDILRAAVAFVSFCAVSSTGYILNDWIDREADRPHPEKRRRPLASGELTGTDALTIGSCTAFAAFICGAALGSPFVGILLGYVVLQWLYSSFAKKIVILDVVVIAIGFVMRASD